MGRNVSHLSPSAMSKAWAHLFYSSDFSWGKNSYWNCESEGIKDHKDHKMVQLGRLQNSTSFAELSVKRH